ncbi:MAG: PLP-dependent transferase [Gammaproteobacteria bacterium]
MSASRTTPAGEEGKLPVEEAAVLECGNVFPVAAGQPLPGYLPPEDPDSVAPRVFYARAGHPAVWRLESALAALEGGETAVCAASGMAAIAQTMFSLLSAGDTLLYSRWAYPNTVDFFEQHLARLGVRVVASDSGDPASLARDVDAFKPKVLFFEPVGNPSLAFSDPAGVAGICRPLGVVSVADNSLLSPVLLRPLEAGIDIVVHSLTKIIGGFGKAMGGVTVGRAELLDPVARLRWSMGSVLAPLLADRILEGIDSLPERVARTSASALQIARFLAADRRVSRVVYPLLPDYPWGESFSHVCSAGGGIVTFFHVGGTGAVHEMARRADTIRFAPSFGKSVTTCNGGAAMERYYRQPPGFIRLSV